MKLALSIIALSSFFILACIGVIADHYMSKDNHTSANCTAALYNDGFQPTTYEQNVAYKERVNKACR